MILSGQENSYFAGFSPGGQLAKLSKQQVSWRISRSKRNKQIGTERVDEEFKLTKIPTMGKNNNNKKSLNECQIGSDVIRTIKKSCGKAKTRRAGRSENTITRTASLPMSRTTSSDSHSSTSNTGTDTEGAVSYTHLTLPTILLV